MAETTIASYGSRSLLPSSLMRGSSTHQHTGAFSLREAPEETVICSGGVQAGPDSTYKPDLGHHSACRSKQPQTLPSLRLAVQPSCNALLGCEPRCKTPSLQLKTSGNPPTWMPLHRTSLTEIKWLPMSLLGERSEAGRSRGPAFF